MRPTIIYYTHNREHPGFEKKVRETILANCGGLPIISVSHKPMDFGTNICVGDQPLAYSNVLRQTLIGLKAAKTKFCIACEDDCLYPPEYFQFTPLDPENSSLQTGDEPRKNSALQGGDLTGFTPPTINNVYRYTNLMVYFEGKNKFWKKPYVEAAQMAGREFWIQRIERVVEGHEGWEPFPVNPPYVFAPGTTHAWSGTSPVIYVKTRKSLHFKTGFVLYSSVTNLPYWGTVEEVREKYCI